MKHLITARGIAAVILAVSLAALAACGTTIVNNPPAPASSTWSAQQATVQGCRSLAQWENGSSTGAQADAATSTIVQSIIAAASGTKFASDTTGWVDDLQDGDTADATSDVAKVDADCTDAGVPNVIG